MSNEKGGPSPEVVAIIGIKKRVDSVATEEAESNF